MSLNVFEIFPWGGFLVSGPCGPRQCLIWFQFSWICWGLFCVLLWSIFEKFHVHLKRMCILLLWDERFYIYQLSAFDVGHCSMLWYPCWLFLEYLSIVDSGELKSPKIIVLLSISLLKSSKIFLIHLGAPMLGAYRFTIFVSSWWILPLSIMKWPSGSLFMTPFLKSILSDMSSATPAFLSSPFAWKICF